MLIVILLHFSTKVKLIFQNFQIIILSCNKRKSGKGRLVTPLIGGDNFMTIDLLMVLLILVVFFLILKIDIKK